MSAAAIIRAAAPQPCQPWPRHLLSTTAWRGLVAALAAEPGVELLALWADAAAVHALLRDPEDGAFLLASTLVEAGWYPALSPVRPAAAWFERMIHDLWGHDAADAADGRAWLDHGCWAETAPLSARPSVHVGGPEPAEFLTATGAGVHRLTLGPFTGDGGESALFRFHLRGEAVLRLEARLGYLHKGTLGLMRGRSPRAAARFAARLAGDATVAHSIAFARAAEAAAFAEPPPRARALRAVMGEIERLANHFADCAAIAAAAGFAGLAAHDMRRREGLLRAAAAAFGHRLMMDCVVPGGVAADIAPEGAAAVIAAAAPAGASPRCLDRIAGIGVVDPGLAARFAAGGIVGRAAGRRFDTRETPGYPPYDGLGFAVPLGEAGDAAARLSLRRAEQAASAALLHDLLARLPDGPLAITLPMTSGEGLGWAEGPRGDVWHWLRLDGGQIASAFARDPAWLHWPLLEAAMAGGALEDFALCRASFGVSVSGVDL